MFISFTPFHFISAYPTNNNYRTVALFHLLAAYYQLPHILAFVEQCEYAGLVLSASQGTQRNIHDTDEVIVLFIVFVVDFESQLLPCFKDVVHHETLGKVGVQIIHDRLRLPDEHHGFIGMPLEEDLDVGIALAEEIKVTQSACIQK